MFLSVLATVVVEPEKEDMPVTSSAAESAARSPFEILIAIAPGTASFPRTSA